MVRASESGKCYVPTIQFVRVSSHGRAAAQLASAHPTAMSSRKSLTDKDGLLKFLRRRLSRFWQKVPFGGQNDGNSAGKSAAFELEGTRFDPEHEQNSTTTF
ncbi:hypothetical protein EVAR_64605_1 [Eumeta japonica]|uniref:Uncharacterized protein n=1 Tax=Eumeta variegata TaxID=151549 RepID=A0A4C1ZD96_EUMVA|nr:hypothetical protein EVAR_64605_1 [Eumeta japonica]